MITDYNNTMLSSPNVREVGPHGHRWSTVGGDLQGDIYQECSVCGSRRVRTNANGRVPLRKDWLEGTSWEIEPEVDEGRARRKLSSSKSESK
jgi:hypothetical protein